MPRKSKEELVEKDIIDSKKTSNAKPSTVKAKATKTSSSGKKATSTKKTTTSKKVATSKKATASSKATTAKKPATAKKTTTSKKVATSKKVTSTSKPKTTKKASTASKVKVSSKTSAGSTSNKASKSKSAKSSKVAKRKISSKILKLSSKTFTKSVDKSELPFVLEYYDLPYKYNKTIIKALAQNPNTLFVYWEISDEDVQNFKEKYGENFFYTTRPVLIVHNLTDKYSFEIDINDFANNWYIHVNDTKCQYVIELGRRPKEGEVNNLPDNYLYVTSSNMIESPNDHVLFYDSEQYREIRFKNIHTNKYTTKVIKPFLKNVYELYKSLHLDKENVSFDFKNPSSQNPTSNVY